MSDKLEKFLNSITNYPRIRPARRPVIEYGDDVPRNIDLLRYNKVDNRSVVPSFAWASGNDVYAGHNDPYVYVRTFDNGGRGPQGLKESFRAEYSYTFSELRVNHVQKINNQWNEVVLNATATFSTNGNLESIFFTFGTKRGYDDTSFTHIRVSPDTSAVLTGSSNSTVSTEDFSIEVRNQRLYIVPNKRIYNGLDISTAIASTSFPLTIDFKKAMDEIKKGEYVFGSNGLGIDQISGHRYYEEERASED